jgi:hypothetical protein
MTVNLDWLLSAALLLSAFAVLVAALLIARRRLVGAVPAAPQEILLLVKLLSVAWSVTLVTYLPFALEVAGRLYRGEWSARMILFWPVLTPLIAVVIVPVATVAVWSGHSVFGSCLLLLVGANWLLFEVLGTRLALFRMTFRPDRLWAVPLLSVMTVLVLGLAATRKIGRA